MADPLQSDSLAGGIPAGIPRAALVTGAARRLGRAIALGLAEAGFAVAVHSHTSAADAGITCAEILQRGRATVALRADLAREAEVADLLPAAEAALGPIGVLVNNASVFERDEWHDATRESWERHIEPQPRRACAHARTLRAACRRGPRASWSTCSTNGSGRSHSDLHCVLQLSPRPRCGR